MCVGVCVEGGVCNHSGVIPFPIIVYNTHVLFHTYYGLLHCPQLFAQKSSLEKDITYTNIGRVNCKDILSSKVKD